MLGVCFHTRANKLAPKSEDMMFIGYKPGTKGYRFWSKIRRTVAISSTAAFDEFDLPNCPREKALDKPPPPEIQSPEMSDTEDMDHDHNDQGGDDDLQPPDQNQPKVPSPRAQSDHGLPDTDTEDDDEDLYGRRHLGCHHTLQTRKGARRQERPSREVLLLPLYHLDHQSHLDLHFHLVINLHLGNLEWAMKRDTLERP